MQKSMRIYLPKSRIWQKQHANQAVRVPSVICYKAGMEIGDLIDVEVVLVRKKEGKA